MRWGATQLIHFHPELGVKSGPGADDGEDLARALEISSAVSSGQLPQGRRMVSKTLAGPPAKKSSSRALFSSSGV